MMTIFFFLFLFFKDTLIKGAVALISELYWDRIKSKGIFRYESISPIIERFLEKTTKHFIGNGKNAMI